MKFKIYKHSFYKKMFLYIAILVLVIISTLSFIFYFNFENVGLKLQYEANKNILSEISYSATYLDDTARNTAAYIYTNNDYSALRYGRHTAPEDAYRLVSSLEALVTQSGNVQSIYIYNRDINTFYSTWWRYYSPAGDFMDSDIADIIENNKIPGRENFTSNPLLRNVPLNFNIGTDRASMNVLTYVMADYTQDGSEIQSAIIINMNSQYLDGLINILNTKGAFTGGDTLIIDNSGFVVASSNSSTAFSDFKNKTYVNRILTSSAKNGYFVDTLDGHEVVVTYVASDVTDWRFVNITPFNQLFKDINRMKTTLYVLCIATVILGFLLSYFLSRHLCHPINRMLGKVQQLSNVEMDRTRKNELDFLTDIFAETIKKAQSIQSVSHENYILKRTAILRELLTNENRNTSEFEETFKKYRLNLNPQGIFMLCNLQPDNYKLFTQELSSDDQKLFRFAVCNVAGELVSKYFSNECFEFDDGNIALIMETTNCENSDIRKNAVEVIGELQAWCQANLSISLSSALYTDPVGLADLAEGYRFVLQLSKYRLVYGCKCLLLPEVIYRLKSNAFEHPGALEQRLDEALNNGRLAESVEAYHKIKEYITDYSYETINSYILYLSYLLMKKFNELEARGYEKITFDSGSYITEIISLETLQEIDERIIRLFRIITDTIEQRRFRKRSNLVDRVTAIIEAEYMDKSLCQDVVAGRLNISRDYLGKMFREAHSKSFADYLTETRLQKAVEYMESSRLSISDIMDRIGWENKNYFYTTFKLKFGMTTSQYRNMSSNN